MASEGGGGSGMDLATLIVGLVVLGALAEVGYTQIMKRFAPAPQTAQETQATTTAATQ